MDNNVTKAKSSEHKDIIINVGRQIGSGGHDIAKRLAGVFGCKFYDKELLNLAAMESGFSEKFFEQNDEQKGFFESLFHLHMPMMTDANFYDNEFSQESLYKFQSDAIRKAAAEGPCVFVGRTADYILRDMKNVVNVFITCNIDHRLPARLQAAGAVARRRTQIYPHTRGRTRKILQLLHRQDMGTCHKLRPVHRLLAARRRRDG